MLFSDCGNVADCQDCTIAEEICFEQCGQNLEGPLEENVLEIIPGVEDELSCKAGDFELYLCLLVITNYRIH